MNVVILAILAGATLTADTVVEAQTVPDQVVGPYGALVLAVLVIWALWREHVKADDKRAADLTVALAGWQGQTDATKELTMELRKSVPRPPRRRSTSG